MSEFGRDRDIDRYQTVEVLGHGAYGRVYKARDTVTGAYIALKRMTLNLETEGVPTTSLREVCLLRELNHPNIVALYDVVITEKKLFLIFEYIEKDLRKVMEEQALQAPQIKKIMHQLMKALCFCHSRRFMHRDLKPENILIDTNFNIKVADFGLARAYTIPGRPYSNEVQTLWYRSPELLLGCEIYSVSIDMWSAGCIFAELVTHRVLFPGTTPFGELNEIFRIMGTPMESAWPGVTTMKNFPQNQEIYPGIPFSQLFNQLDEYGLDLLSKMLIMNPAQRISAKQALNHPYFADVEEN